MIAGVHFVKKHLREGVAWYVYAWRGGPQVFRAMGAKKPKLGPNVLKAIADALDERDIRDEDNLCSLIRLWRSNNPSRPSSPDWERLAITTKRTWGSALDRIEEKWGNVPLKVFNDPRMKAKVVAWQHSRASSPRAADIGVTVLKALLKFGTLRGKVTINVADGIPNLYRGGDRAEIIWTDNELVRFHEKAVEMGMLAASDGLRLAALTGLRREDLVTLSWSEVSQFAIVKKALKRSRGRRRFASVVRIPQLDSLLEELEARPRQSDVQTVLVDGHGKPWSPDRLTKAVGKVRDTLRIVHIDDETGMKSKKHLHDARGTFATKLMTETDLTDQEMAGMMGWSPDEVSRIRHVYVDQRKVVVALGAKMRRAV